MNKNLIIGLLVAAVVLIGIVFAVQSYVPSQNPIATSTTQATLPDRTQTYTPPPSPQPAAPTVTTDVNTAVSHSTAVVTGKVTPNGAQTSYWYEYGTTTALGGHTASQAIGSGFIAISAPAYITGLSASTFYYYRLVASNGFGTVNGNTLAFTTNNNPPPQGTAPTTHTDAATDASRTTANLNGRVTPNGSDTSFWFEYGETTDLGSTTAFQSAGAGTGSLNVSVSLSGLKPLTKYYFRLNAQNQYGTVNGSILNFTTTGPAAPGVPAVTSKAATSIATSSVTMNGQINPNGADTTYWFEYGTDSLLGNILGNTTQTQVAASNSGNTAVSAGVNGLDSATRYYYRLVASNPYGTVRGSIINFKTR